MSISVDVTGISKTKSFLNKKNTQTKSLVKKGLTNAAIFLQGEVKMSIAGQRSELRSVDTGRFLNSVGINVGKNDAEVFSALSYAKFLEFGTSKFPGRKHFQNSKDRNKQKISQIIQKSVNQI